MDTLPEPLPSEIWQPVVLTPEELTPLPDAERALPVLRLFSGLLGRRNEKFKVAILRELTVQPRGRWKIREIQDSLSWLDTASTTRLVSDLRQAGLFVYDEASDLYRLSNEARVVAALCGALSVPDISYSRIIKVLGAIMAMALATGAPEQAAYAPFLQALAILDEDYEQLLKLLDDRSVDALLDAANRAQLHVLDMKELMDEQQDLFARFHDDASYLAHDERAASLIARLGGLAAEVVKALSREADELMRGGIRFDRQDLRELVAESELGQLAALVVDAAQPPAIAPVDTSRIFAALDQLLSQDERRPSQLPEPVLLTANRQSEPEPDEFQRASDALAVLASPVGTPLVQWVVGESWAMAVHRLNAAIEAWSRYGPGGTSRLGCDLVALPEIDIVSRDGVAAMSVTLVKTRETVVERA